VKSDPFSLGFLWEGISAGFALAVTATLAFLLIAPAGVLIGGFFKPKQKSTD
jgi:hypothetical protein